MRASLEKLTNEQLLNLKKQALEKARELSNSSRISEEFQVFYATAINNVKRCISEEFMI